MKQKGFTLIELLVVIAIIGLLSTLAVVALNSARLRSRDAKRVADIRQMQTALELAFSETSAYPMANPTAITLGTTNYKVLCKVGSAAVFQAAVTGCDPVYMGLVPESPSPGEAIYSYITSAGGDAYSLTFRLEGNTGQLEAGDNCANANGITKLVAPATNCL